MSYALACLSSTIWLFSATALLSYDNMNRKKYTIIVHILHSLELIASSPLKIGPNCPKNGNRSSSNHGIFGCRVSAVGLREVVPLQDDVETSLQNPDFFRNHILSPNKKHSLKRTANASENRPKLPQRRKVFIFQSLIFRDELLVSGRVPCFPSKRHRKWAFLTPRNMISDLHEKWWMEEEQKYTARYHGRKHQQLEDMRVMLLCHRTYLNSRES